MTTVLNRNAQLPAENSKLGFTRQRLKPTTNVLVLRMLFSTNKDGQDWKPCLCSECSEEPPERRKWPASKCSRARDGWSPAHKHGGEV